MTSRNDMSRRGFLSLTGRAALGGLAAGVPGLARSATNSPAARKPNFIIVFTDDQGYQDVGCFGSPKIKTPHLDRMAAEGTRFTSFYAQTVCGPSRAALMTGCYPLRVARKGNRSEEVHPRLHSREITVAEVLKGAGYATAAFGKWDLAGHSQTEYAPELLPTKQGFDYFFGTPTSNDKLVNLLRNESVIEKKTDMGTLTRRYTDEAIAFMQKHRDGPLFVYLAHTMPHTRLAVSESFKNKSARGLYGDVIEEIDSNVGRMLQALREMGLEKDTYVLFTSDNGPWLYPGGGWGRSHGGNAEPLRGAKTSTWEGGLRVPCIAWAPGRIPAGRTCDEVASTLDVLPTFAALAGAEVPADRVIDGHDIRDLLHGTPGATSPTKAFFYYAHTHLQAVRSSRWKLHLPRPAEPPWTPKWGHFIEKQDVFAVEKPLLFDLQTDIGERTDVADKHPDVVARLLELAEWARNDIGDYDRAGKNARFFDPGPRRPDAEKWKGKPSN